LKFDLLFAGNRNVGNKMSKKIFEPKKVEEVSNLEYYIYHELCRTHIGGI
jgi:hypothetical protein